MLKILIMWSTHRYSSGVSFSGIAVTSKNENAQIEKLSKFRGATKSTKNIGHQGLFRGRGDLPPMTTDLSGGEIQIPIVLFGSPSSQGGKTRDQVTGEGRLGGRGGFGIYGAFRKSLRRTLRAPSFVGNQFQQSSAPIGTSEPKASRSSPHLKGMFANAKHQYRRKIQSRGRGQL